MFPVAQKSIVRDKQFAGVALRVYLCAVALLLPFFCGCPACGTDTPTMPQDFLVWMFLGFTPGAPAFCGALLSGIGLLGAVLVHPWSGRDRSLKYVLAWYGLVFAGLVGLSVTTELDYAHNWLIHFLGAGCFGLSVWWTARHDAHLVLWLWNVIGVGALIMCVNGWYQHLWGQMETLETLQQEHLALFGRELSALFVQKIRQGRVNGFFSDPNLFAAHLLVTGPVALLAVWRWLSGRGRVRFIAVALTGVLILFTLVLTGSRGGQVGAAAGIAVFIWLLPQVQRLRYRWFLPLLAVAFAVVLLVMMRMHSGTSVKMASATARIIYYETAMKMVSQYPWTGVGLGEFYPRYIQMRPLGAEITRDPHCFLLSALVQNGIAGGLAVMLLAAFPVVLLLRRTFQRRAVACVESAASSRCTFRFVLLTCGYFAWMVHSLVQFNELVPGTVYILAAMPVIAGWGELCVLTDMVPSGKSCWAVRFLPVVPALVCVVWVLMRIPPEVRLSESEEALMELEKINSELNKMPRDSSLRQVLADAHARGYGEWKQKAFALTDALPFSTAPCMMLYSTLKREIMDGEGVVESPSDIVAQLLAAGRRMAARVPHRTIGWDQVAWAAIAAGQWSQAEEAVRRGMEWGPWDGRLQLLKAIALARQPVYLPLVDQIPFCLILREAGVLTLCVNPADEQQRNQILELFSAALAGGYDMPVKVDPVQEQNKK